MPKIQCEICLKEIDVENKDYIVENKCFYHKNCYISKIKIEKKAIFLPKLKKFFTYFIASLMLFIILSFFQDFGNLFIAFIWFTSFVLTVTFIMMFFLVLFKMNH
ncbi:MAG: hypothetical protein ACTSQJ_17365 [Promethearchaeota archaeon]